MVRWAFDILGIEVTKDIRQIKRIYAVLVRQYHPEEHPLEWARVHEAYQIAVEYAKTPEPLSGGIPDIKIPEPASGEMTDIRISEPAAEGITDIRLPEIKIPEFPQGENTVKQEDPAEFPLDGFRFEEKWKTESQRNVEVTEDAGYEELFPEEEFHWVKEKAERRQMLQQRLKKLAELCGRKAAKEWRHFFEEEFLLDEGVEELILLLDVVKKGELSEKSIQVILPEMEKREENYASREEYNCMRIAEEIIDGCRKRLVVCGELQKKTDKFSRKCTMVVLFFCVVFTFLTDFGDEDKEEERGKGSVTIFTAANLNNKYDTLNYNIETLSVEETEISDENGDEMVFYEVMTKDSWGATACVIPIQETERKTRHIIFDNIQSEEIKQALEDKLNERTGCAQGRLFWDSSMHTFDGVEDGFFQTRYDGDVEAFIQREAEVRKDVPRSLTAYLARNPDAVNGYCEYYVPGPWFVIEEDQQMEEIFEEEEEEFLSEIAGISDELEKCAVDYHIQICGIILPDFLFERAIELDETESVSIEELRNEAWRGYVFGEYVPEDADDVGDR